MSPSILVTLLLVTGPYSLSIGETRLVIDKSKAHYAQAGINLKVNRIIKRRDSRANLETISESERKFDLYRSFVRRAKINSRSRVHILLPPMQEPGGIRYIGGWGESGCNPRGVSSSNAQSVRSNGLDGLEPSSIAMSHEVGHTLNAVHNDKTSNIMHSAALQFTGQPIGFLSSTIYRMKRCLGGRK